MFVAAQSGSKQDVTKITLSKFIDDSGERVATGAKLCPLGRNLTIAAVKASVCGWVVRFVHWEPSRGFLKSNFNLATQGSSD